MSDRIVDHYAVLGVLPDAEHVVIVAAYRALAQRYHPDRAGDNEASAHDRMSAINEAYRVLSDPDARARYDEELRCRKRGAFDEENRKSREGEFSAGLADLEERWKIACDVLPDLKELRARVSRLSRSLEFAYLTMLLENRCFNQRQEIAESLIAAFLARYFGESALVVDYARGLLLSGRRSEARALNQLVEVLGDAVPAKYLIDRLEAQFPDLAKDRVVKEEREARIGRLLRSVHFDSSYEAAKQLSEEFGYSIDRQSGGFLGLGAPIVTATRDGGVNLTFRGEASFRRWVNTYIRSIANEG